MIKKNMSLLEISKMINEEIDSPTKFADLLTNAKYQKADRLKIGRKEYHYAIEGTYSTGQLSVVETILESNRKNRYTDVDTLIGDIHILYAEIWKDQRRLHPTKMPSRSLEEIINIEIEKDNQVIQ